MSCDCHKIGKFITYDPECPIHNPNHVDYVDLDELKINAARYVKLREMLVHQHRGPFVGWTLDVLMPGDYPDEAVDAWGENERT